MKNLSHSGRSMTCQLPMLLHWPHRYGVYDGIGSEPSHGSIGGCQDGRGVRVTLRISAVTLGWLFGMMPSSAVVMFASMSGCTAGADTFQSYAVSTFGCQNGSATLNEASAPRTKARSQCTHRYGVYDGVDMLPIQGSMIGWSGGKGCLPGFAISVEKFGWPAGTMSAQ
jgi:hypothetical protein